MSFFEEVDVAFPVVIGDTVTFNLTHKGKYLNGKGLAGVAWPAPPHEAASSRQQLPQAQTPPPLPPPALLKTKLAPAKSTPGARPALHALDAAQLEALYSEESATAKVEPARLGQISNQVRYARIEKSLAELKGLLREVRALLEKTYFREK